MATIEVITDIITKYDFKDLSASLERLRTDEQALYIGILGEFNTGKSTLVNGMLGRKILPAMVKPTTARITEILPELNRDELGFYLRDEEGGVTPISALEIDDALLNGGKEVAIIKTPTNDLLHDGYCVVDTPGLASLDKMHTDITFGYLPFLDGAIICHDIQKGGLTESLRAFLTKPEVRPLLGRVLFLLTRADTKDPQSAETMRRAFTDELSLLLSNLQGNSDDLNQRVLAFSPLEMLRNGSGKSELANAFTNIFLAGRQSMIKDRIAYEQKIITNDAINRLHRMRDNLNLDRSEYSQQREKILAELSDIESQRREIEQTMNAMKPELTTIINQHVTDLRATLLSSSQSDISVAFAEFQESLQIAVSRHIQSRFSTHSQLNIDASAQVLQLRLDKLAGIIDAGKFIATAAIVAFLVPESVVATEAVQTAVAGEVIEGAIGANVLGMTKGSRLGDFVKTVNPAEIVGQLAHNYFKEKSIDQEVRELGARISLNILEQIKGAVRVELIGPSENSCKAAKVQLDTLLASEKKGAKEIQAERESIAQDILMIS